MKTPSIGSNVGKAMAGTFKRMAVLVFLVVAVTIPIGWIMNLFDVMEVVSTGQIDVNGALHIIGIFILPMGAFMGVFF